MVADGGAEGWHGGEKQPFWRCVRMLQELHGPRTLTGWEGSEGEGGV